jgi:hypothetical protein
MWVVSSIFREFQPFITATIVVAAASTALWHFTIQRYEPSINILPILAILLCKILLSYLSWTGSVLGPGPDCEPKDLATSEMRYDMLSAIQAVKRVDRYWGDVKFEIPIPGRYYLPTNHRVPVYLLALPLRFVSAYPEVAIPWNAFYSLLSATAVLGIASCTHLTAIHRKHVFLLAFLVPFTWFNGTLYKDIALQAVLCVFVLGVVSFRNKRALNAVVIVAGSALLYQFRSPYMLWGLCVGAYVILGICSRRPSLVTLAVAAALAVVFWLTPLKNRYLLEVRDEYADKTPLSQPLNFASGGPSEFPKRLVLGLLTPFPWDQVFTNATRYHTRIAEYAQVTLTLALLTLLVPMGIYQFRDGIPLPPATLAAFLYIGIGICGPTIHHGYTQAGAILLLPQGIALGRGTLLRRCWYCLLVLLCLNAVWLSGVRAIMGGGS